MPSGGVNDVNRLRIPPEIEFATNFGFPVLRNRGNTTAHHDQFLREIGHLGIERDGLRNIGERAGSVYGYFMRVLMQHADDEVGGIFVSGLGSWISLFEGRDFVWAMVEAANAIAGGQAIPGALVIDLAVE